MTNQQVIEMSRGELYQRVWATPMRKLAGEWGLSDVGLAKICKKHNIPRPPVGHWEKKRHGKRVRQTPLPEIKDDRLKTVQISPKEPAVEPVAADSEIAQLIRQESDPKWSIEVSEQVQIRHPIVQSTKQSLKGQDPDKYGRVSRIWNFGSSCFDVRVSLENISRSLRILQGLTTAMQARGYSLNLRKDKSERPYFDVLGEEIEVTLRESSKRSERKQDRSQRDSWFFERYEYTPTGVLELGINSDRYSSWATIRDTNTKPLECRLNEVVVSILKGVERSRTWREAARIEKIQKAERKEQAVAQEIERRSDSARITRLQHLAQLWEKHQRLSRFVDVVRAEADSRSPSIDPDTLDWLTWADAFLRELDPLSGGEDLPVYTLSAEEREQLRRECEADWCGYSETFYRR
ncbi:MAG: hypothetical protein KDA90_01305 [Planctomycetaceae bacterium]|nr:hypothetical protein [Planctomycetaceae bacterium]